MRENKNFIKIRHHGELRDLEDTLTDNIEDIIYYSSKFPEDIDITIFILAKNFGKQYYYKKDFNLGYETICDTSKAILNDYRKIMKDKYDINADYDLLSFRISITL